MGVHKEKNLNQLSETCMVPACPGWGLVNEIYAVPIGFDVPQRDEKENIMQIKRKGLLAHLGLGPQLILLSFFQLT